MSVAKHTVYNLGSALVPIAISFVTVPLTIDAVGVARFGVMALFTLMLGYAGIFDFGLSAATAQRVASVRGDDLEARRQIVWTALTVNLGFGLVGALTILPVAQLFLLDGLKAPPELRPEIAASIIWLALAMPLMLLTGVCRGALQGASRFAELNLINVIGSPVTQVLPLLAALMISPRLDVVLPVLFATRSAFLVACGWVVAARVLYSWRPAFDRRRVRNLLSFGGWVAISAMIAPVMNALDRFVIGWQVSVQAVSHYTVPLQLTERTLVFPGALVDALFPRMAGAEEHEAHGFARRSLQLVAAMMTTPMVAGVLILHPFLKLWIDSSFADEAATPGRILLVGFWFTALGLCCRYRLNAAGRPRLVALANLIEVLPYALLLIVALNLFGVAGAAIVFGIRALADAAILAWFAGLLRDLLQIALLPVVLLGGALALGPAVQAGSPLGLALSATLVAATAISGAIQAYRQHPEVRHMVSRTLMSLQRAR